MIQTINPYASARTAEIMSRYRPIAPKPENPNPNLTPENENAAVPSGIRNSPYLRNVWAHLQSRPTRTRKRGRTTSFPSSSVKRTRPCLPGLISSPAYHVTHSTADNLGVHGFAHAAANFVPRNGCLDTAVTTLAESVALPLMCCTAAAEAAAEPPVSIEGKEKGIDLNMTAAVEELDLFPEPVKRRVISPRPVRPVGSSIFVDKISDDFRQQTIAVMGLEEVEEMVEAEKLPVIVSDSNNKVRMCNSAYKELIGQPECGWLDCAAGKNCGGGFCRRIGGEIVLHFLDSKVQMSMHGFSCRAKIEWECKGIKKCVNGYCHGVKVDCDRKDYQFMWRFNAINDRLRCGSDD